MEPFNTAFDGISPSFEPYKRVLSILAVFREHILLFFLLKQRYMYKLSDSLHMGISASDEFIELPNCCFLNCPMGATYYIQPRCREWAEWRRTGLLCIRGWGVLRGWGTSTAEWKQTAGVEAMCTVLLDSNQNIKLTTTWMHCGQSAFRVLTIQEAHSSRHWPQYDLSRREVDPGHPRRNVLRAPTFARNAKRNTNQIDRINQFAGFSLRQWLV